MMDAKISRRQFGNVLGKISALVVVTSVWKPAQAADAEVTISRNHGHQFTITLDALLANGPKTYDISGRANHGHDLIVTQEMLNALLAAGAVEIESTGEVGHTHLVRITRR